jgi:hypothetical protein
MKTLKITLSVIVMLALSGLNASGQFGAQWAWNGIHIYNTNFNIPNTNVGIGISSPSSLLHVAKNMQEPTITVQNLGGPGGATFRMMDGNNSDWKFKVANNRGFKIRDNKIGLDVVTIEQNAAVNAFYIKQGGNVGLGNGNPLEKLHINGAVTIGNTSGNLPGTIRWNGNNFQGRNGTGWVNLDAQASAPCLEQDIENSTFLIATSNYTVPAGYNLFITNFINVTGTGQNDIKINGISDILYNGVKDNPVILSPGDNIVMVSGAKISGQLIPFKYYSIFLDISGSSYTVPPNKKLIILGVYADSFTWPGESEELLVNGNSIGNAYTRETGVPFPMAFTAGTIISTLNVSQEMVISGYLINQ